MTYQESKAPKLIAGSIAAAIIGLFLVLVAAIFVPKLRQEYQEHRLGQCEDRYPVQSGAWRPIFGFDMGGRSILGDAPESRALIECIVESQTVRFSATPLYSEDDPRLPALSVTYFSFSYGLVFQHYPGASEIR